MAGEAPQALSPYRVLDLTTEIGQYAGRAFAELGADVIKIEPPDGDAVRRIGPFVRDEAKPDRSLLWFVLNASKRGITLDLTRPDGQALFRRLVAEADVVLESHRPGELDALSIGYDQLRAEHPKLVWVSITGFGQDGPYRDYQWSDLIGLALGGLLYLWGEEGRPPTRARASQAYYHVSFGAALGGMLALYHARRTGRGQRVDASMQEIVTFTLGGPGAITAFWSLQHQNITRSGPGINLGNMISRVLYACQDGHVAVSTIFGPHFPTTIELMQRDGAAGFLADEKWRTATRFSPLPGQWQCSQEEANAIEEVFARWIGKFTRAEILAMAREHELMIFPVNTVADNIDSEQLAARGFYQRVEHEDIGATVTYPGAPVVLSKTPWRMKGRAPRLGEHNADVYGAIGVGADELERLRTAGVV
jgi:crotonobetainyl-CoA:carnitine CoA-transferase CaiB-like acyl-CoA transferase